MSQNSHGQNKISAHINRKHISMQKRLTIKKVSEKISHSQKSQYGANNRIHSGNEHKKK